MTKKRKVTIICASAFSLSVFAASEFQACFWSHDYAKSRALKIITDRCISAGRNPKLLSQKSEAKVGNEPFAFEWIYEGSPRYLYGIWFSRNGHAESYGGDPDDPQSAAYEEPETKK